MNRKFLFLTVTLVAAIITSSIVYFLQNNKIKKLEARALLLQTQIISRESKAVRGDNKTGFLKIDENKYVGEAVVSGKYYLTGSKPEVCFSPDKESLALLPESNTVQIFCILPPKSGDYEEIIKVFYGFGRKEALGDFTKYGTIEMARQGKVIILDYEIKKFNEFSKTGYATLVKIIERS